jgi:hypothetical protein
MRRTTILAAAVLLTACADSTEPEGGLTKDEAGSLAAAILNLSLDASLESGGDGPFAAPGAGPAAAPSAAPSSFSEHFSGEGPCALGGTMFADVTASGSFDDATQSGSLDFKVEAKHHGCQVKTEEGRLFTIDGKPSIKAELHMVAKQGKALELSGSYDGDVDWQSDGKSGSCHFDLDFSGSVDMNTDKAAATMKGKACGATISHEFSAS